MNDRSNSLHCNQSSRQKYVSDDVLARIYSLPLGVVLDYCVQGLFVGASYSRTRRRWFIPVPLRIVSHG